MQARETELHRVYTAECLRIISQLSGWLIPGQDVMTQTYLSMIRPEKDDGVPDEVRAEKIKKDVLSRLEGDE